MPDRQGGARRPTIRTSPTRRGSPRAWSRWCSAARPGRALPRASGPGGVDPARLPRGPHRRPAGPAPDEDPGRHVHPGQPVPRRAGRGDQGRSRGGGLRAGAELDGRRPRRGPRDRDPGRLPLRGPAPAGPDAPGGPARGRPRAGDGLVLGRPLHMPSANSSARTTSRASRRPSSTSSRSGTAGSPTSTAERAPSPRSAATRTSVPPRSVGSTRSSCPAASPRTTGPLSRPITYPRASPPWSPSTTGRRSASSTGWSTAVSRCRRGCR